MKKNHKKIGVILLAAGGFMLLMGLALAVTVGTVIVPVLLTSSVFVNTAGFVILQGGRGKWK